MRFRIRGILFSLTLLFSLPVFSQERPSYTPTIAALSDPAKIATLKGERAANDRVLKLLAALESARRDGVHPAKSIDDAQKLTGDTGAHGQLVKAMLLRNFEDAQRSGLFTEENLERMRAGKSPLVTSGSLVGQTYEVDHILPLDAFPKLGNEIANLMLIPRSINRRKSDAVKQRSIDLAQRMIAAGLITREEYNEARRLRKESF